MYYIKILFFAGLAGLVPPAFDPARGEDGVVLAAAITAPSQAMKDNCEARCDDDAERKIDPELEQARAYLLETARPGGTMVRQGPELAIERLHPEFAKRLAAAIREVRDAGLADAGVFSAYRPPAFGVGGFADKFYSLHAYGLAVDMFGIGAAGSVQAKIWHETAAKHGIVCPYGYRNRLEWNHCQPTQLQAVKSDNPLRDTITGAGPVDLERMFEAGNEVLANVQTALASVIENRPISDVVPAAAPQSRLSFSRRFVRAFVRTGQKRVKPITVREVIARSGNNVTPAGTQVVSNTPTLSRAKVVTVKKSELVYASRIQPGRGTKVHLKQ